MKQLLIVSLLTVCVLCANTNTVNLSGWVLQYSIEGVNIKFTLTGTNKGYIALGLGGDGMDKIDVAALKYDGSKVVIEDRNNIDTTVATNSVPIDSTSSDFTLEASSSYDASTGAWSATFSRKLDTGDKFDNVITDGSDINLALGLFSDMTWKQHSSQQYGSVKLTSAQSDPVNLHSYTLSVSAAVLAILAFIC